MRDPFLLSATAAVSWNFFKFVSCNSNKPDTLANDSDRQYRRVVKYVSCFGGVQGLNILAALVRNKIAAVLLGPAGLGLMSLYNTAVKFVTDALNLGLPVSAVRYLAECSNQQEAQAMVRMVRFWSLLTAVVGMAACAVLSPVFSYFYFGDISRWLEFLWLAPVCAFTLLASGELALLKGLRRLKEVAVQSVVNALLCIVVTLPFFWLWGIGGILPAVVSAAVAALATVGWYSLRLFPYRLPSAMASAIKDGAGMVKLGLAFVLAGVFGAGVELAVRAFISNYGSVADVGLYNSAYMITITYASLVFASMESDFFPRLSAVNHNVAESNSVVNRQIEVSVVLLAPMLVAFMAALPVIIPLLYSGKFLPSIGMVRFGVIAMLLRAVVLPLEYMSLAKGRSWIYLFTEVVYDAVVVGAIIVGYVLWGLSGAGLGLLAAAVVNLLFVWGVCRHYYSLRVERSASMLFAVQSVVLVASYFVSAFASGVWWWITMAACLAFSAAVSWRHLERNAGISASLKSKFKRKRDENIDSDSGL